ncbi:MAG: urease accessory protein [Yoonia sp.]|jgi:urease accessory protein
MKIVAQTVMKAGTWEGPALNCSLDYDARFLRRKILTSDEGISFLVDLPHTTSLKHGDALVLSDGSRIQIVSAPEPVLKITGTNLIQLAWHIGNRHTPCQMLPDMLVIRDDPVIGHMLEHLGAELTQTLQPFTPEGGAYGHGRTHSHAHGATAHDH